MDPQMTRMFFKSRFSLIIGLLSVIWLVIGCAAPGENGAPGVGWQADWEVMEDFSLSLDSSGFMLPTAIAFVPDPGSDPLDPLYYVAELPGTIKVVTNDRTVLTFAEDFRPSFHSQAFSTIEQHFGLVGLCLDPAEGYIFATHAYRLANGTVRNGLVRFKTTPQVFSTQYDSYVDFNDLFFDFPVIPPVHQIDNCTVVNDYLYIGIGDGGQPAQSTDRNTLLGKVVRMTVDGEPAPDNPFFQDPTAPASYVWASGFRNPFGLEVIDDRVFVADNGIDIDRFLEAKEGDTYLWDGTDLSIGAKADAIFSPALGVTTLKYIPDDTAVLPATFQNSFLLGFSGDLKSAEKVPSRQVEGILNIHHVDDSLAEPPNYLLKYRGGDFRFIVGLALGTDGIYFAPMLPDKNGQSDIYKITFDPDAPHPYIIGQGTNPDPAALMRESGCFACHKMNNYGGSAGPLLDRDLLLPTLRGRLFSEAYLSELDAVDSIPGEPYSSFAEARNLIREAEGPERIQTWLTYHIHEPRFDNPDTQMPNLGLTLEESELIASYLTAKQPLKEQIKGLISQFIPYIGYTHLGVSAIAGFIAGALIASFLALIMIRMRQRRKN